jgi:hypothetical protein
MVKELKEKNIEKGNEMSGDFTSVGGWDLMSV